MTTACVCVVLSLILVHFVDPEIFQSNLSSMCMALVVSTSRSYRLFRLDIEGERKCQGCECLFPRSLDARQPTFTNFEDTRRAGSDFSRSWSCRTSQNPRRIVFNGLHIVTKRRLACGYRYSVICYGMGDRNLIKSDIFPVKNPQNQRSV